MDESDNSLGPPCGRCGLHGAHVCLDGIETYASHRGAGYWEDTDTPMERQRRAYRKRKPTEKGAADGS